MSVAGTVEEIELRAHAINPCLRIANDYLLGSVDARSTARQLVGRGVFGRLLCGEVMLDQAAKDPAMASTWISAAGNYYLAAESYCDGEDESSVSDRAKASVRLAQLSAYKLIYGAGKLPGRAAVENMYSAMAGHALALVNTPPEQLSGSIRTEKQVRGMVPELGVWLLAQRVGLKRQPSGSWLALQSLFTEDHGGSCLRKSDAAKVDINIFTQASRVDPIEGTYRLQVKRQSRFVPKLAGVITIGTENDLGLHPEEEDVSQAIITACNAELHNEAGASRLSEQLDQRTEKLLAKLAI